MWVIGLDVGGGSRRRRRVAVFDRLSQGRLTPKSAVFDKLSQGRLTPKLQYVGFFNVSTRKWIWRERALVFSNNRGFDIS